MSCLISNPYVVGSISIVLTLLGLCYPWFALPSIMLDLYLMY